MATRHQVRESIIALLYAKDVGNENIEDFLDDILEDKKIRNDQKEFAISLFDGIFNNLQEIDNAINKHLKQWQIDDLAHIERSILRLGTYEILKTNLDKAIIINEAIELAKKLGGDNATKFVNGVLDAIKRDNS